MTPLVTFFVGGVQTPLTESVKSSQMFPLDKKRCSVRNDDGEKPARGGRLFDLAVIAYRTGASLDQLAEDDRSASRSFSATSKRSVSQRPKIKKSSVTLNLSTNK